jgi:hypothetical protein
VPRWARNLTGTSSGHYISVNNTSPPRKLERQFRC